LEKFRKIFENNGGCQLPCVWGITPGKTKFGELNETLFSLGYVARFPVDDNLFHYDLIITDPDFLDPYGNQELGVSFICDETIVHEISISSNNIKPPSDTSLAGLLSTFGKPDEILLHFSPIPPFGNPSYSIVLFYKQIGLLVNFHSEIERVGNDLFFCPQEVLGLYHLPIPVYHMWSPSETKMLSDLHHIFYDNLVFTKIEELFALLDTNIFYETYLDPVTDRCFIIPIDSLP
jgi:hypothetical protein